MAAITLKLMIILTLLVIAISLLSFGKKEATKIPIEKDRDLEILPNTSSEDIDIINILEEKFAEDEDIIFGQIESELQ